MLWEETVLFPMLKEDKGGSHNNILDLILREHVKILSDLKKLHTNIENGIDSEKDEEKLILDLLKHEEFEDEVFHPAIVRLLKEGLIEEKE